MLINDAYKTYIIEETDDCFMIDRHAGPLCVF